MDNGQYCHIGLENAVKKIIINRISRNQNFNTINLLINIDGTPLVGRSSEKGLWTILCKDEQLDNVFLVGVYLGTKKPEDPNVFLEAFTNEAMNMINNGIVFDGNEFNIHGAKIYEWVEVFVVSWIRK